VPENFTLSVCCLRLAVGNPARPCRKFANALLSFCAASLYAWAEFSPHHGSTSSLTPAHWYRNPKCDVDRYSVTWDPSPDASFSAFTCAQFCDTRARRWLYMKRDAPRCDDSARSWAVDGSILYRYACVTSTEETVPCTPDKAPNTNHQAPSLPRGIGSLIWRLRVARPR